MRYIPLTMGNQKNLIKSWLVFSIIVLLLIPIIQVLFMQTVNLHFKLRAVFLLQRFNLISSFICMIFVFLISKTNVKFKPKTEISLILFGVILFVLSISTQGDFTKILNEGVSIGIYEGKPITYLDSSRIGIYGLLDVDTNSDFIVLSQGNILTKIIYLDYIPKFPKLKFAFIENRINACSGCKLNLLINNHSIDISYVLNINDYSEFITVPIDRDYLKVGKNRVDFILENSSISLLFFTQTVYYEGNTFVNNIVYPYYESLIYIEEKNVFLYRVLFKLGFIFRFIGTILIFLGAFGTRFISKTYKKHKLELVFSTVIGLIIFWFSLAIRRYWTYLSKYVAVTLYYLLRLFFNDVIFITSNSNTPFVGVGDFVLGIVETCSGIDSIGFYSISYFLLSIYHWKELDLRRIIIFFIPGILGAYLVNIFRVFAIFVVGIFISREFAVNAFHTNIALFMYSIYFILYWIFVSKK